MVKINVPVPFSPVRVGPSRRTNVDVVFGVLKRDCAGFGICRVEPSGQLSKSGGCSVQAKAELFLNRRGEVTMLFAKDMLSEATLERYFAYEHFIVEQAYTIPNHVWPTTGRPFKIASGFYTIIELECHYQLIFSPRFKVN